jgi:hypothetical protein
MPDDDEEIEGQEFQKGLIHLIKREAWKPFELDEDVDEDGVLDLYCDDD